MATTTCPHCGNEISDQIETCIHCGNKITPDKPEQADKSTPAQAASPELPANPAAAGLPVPPVATASVAGSKPAPKKKKLSKKSKIIIAIASAAAVIIAGVIIAFAVNAHQEQVKKEQEVAAYNQYIDDMTQAMLQMLSGAADAEKLCNKTQNVWHSAIFKHSAGEWDEDIRQYYASDFNDALSMLYADSDVSKKVSEIKTNQESVNKLYKKLQNPPSGLSNAFAAFEEMYDAYAKLTKLATSPTGTLQSYGSDFREADNACVRAYDKLKAKIPSKKSTK